ncbi:phage structural protein [Siphovirus Jomon_CT89]|nr:phage structural protein [Siphovirus Jomon_CT89]
MTERSGFFLSINGDRKYSADDFGRMFDGVISDGIFQNWGRAYQVVKGSGREIIIQSGRAWLKGHWLENDSGRYYILNEGATDGDRYDSIFLRVDNTPNVRVGGIRAVQGGVNGDIPQPNQSPDNFEVLLAYVKVPRGAKTNADFEIVDCRGMVGEKYAQWAQSVMQPKQITLNNKYDFLNAFNNDPNLKRVISRGNNLGKTITAAQKMAIRNGTFDGLWLGDYWQYNSNSCKWIIVDFDRWLDHPNGENQHRITVMSDRNLGIDNFDDDPKDQKWANGWYNTRMRNDYANGMVRFATALQVFDISDFKTFPVLEPHAFENTGDSWSLIEKDHRWEYPQVTIPSEFEMFGSNFVSARVNGHDDNLAPIPRQFSYFRLGNPIPNPSENFWFRDQVSKIRFAMYYGDQREVSWAKWTSKYGIRPVVSIGG